MKGENKIEEILNQKNLRKQIELEEASSFYDYGQNHIPHYHDKTFKNLFSNKKEAIHFINQHLKLEKISKALEENQIESYKTEFINSQKEYLETDVLYKIVGTSIFVLIEQQSKVDYFMAQRILYYYVAIMKEAQKEGHQAKRKLPIIYPIVLYTGKAKWTAETEISKIQTEIKGVEKALILKYQLVDIHQYTKEELRKERSSIAKAMLLEKIKDKEELIEELEQLVKEKLTKEEKEFLMDIVTNIVVEEIGKEKAEKLKEKIKGKTVDTMVTENLRNIFRMNYKEGVEKGRLKGRKEGIKEGIKEGVENTIRQMLKNKISEEVIRKVTNISEEELNELKKTI